MTTNDVLLTFLRRRSLSAVRQLAREEGLSVPEWQYEQAERVEGATIAQLEAVLSEYCYNPEVARLLIVRYVLNGREARRFGLDLARVIHVFARRFGDEQLLSLAKVAGAKDLLSELNFVEATVRLERIATVPDAALGSFASFVHCIKKHWLGWAYQRRGDFQRADRELEESIGVADAADFCVRWSYRTARGALLVASGQFRRAVLLLGDEELRRETRNQNDLDTLAYSHLVSTEAALCLTATSKASYELCELQNLIEENQERLGHYRGYLVLLSAKLDTLWGNTAEAAHLYNHAIELFEALDPPLYSAVLDAKLELVKFAARDGRYTIVFQRVGELLDEAEQRGCMDARTRLLAFEAKLFMDEAVPADRLREGYDNLVSRVHLMNNPRLTFMAYAHLYAFARKHLDRPEQSFWLARLHGLQSVLERSCYEDLYRDYVLERYRIEIEAGLSDAQWRLDTDD